MRKTEAQDTSVLVIDNVTKTYTQLQKSGKARDIIKNLLFPKKKEIHALNNLSLEIKKGEFVAYAGANGAGKSTTMKIFAGILQPTNGRVEVLGMNPSEDRIELMKRVGVLFGQRTELWWDQPIITSYQWKKAVWNIPDELYDRNLALVTELLDLAPLLETFSRELSLGQRMRADLGMLLLHSPEVIFLDEPTLGLDVLAKRQMIAFLKKMNREVGTTIVVTSHDMDDLEEMAERIILLSEGQIVFDGDFQQFREHQGGVSDIQIKRLGTAPEMEGMRLLSSKNDLHHYNVLDESMNVSEVIRKIGQLDGILDLEIKKKSLESVVADLYLSLKE